MKIIKITSYVNEMLYINTKVVNEVTNIVQEYFIKDLIEVYMELDQASKDALKLIADKMAEKRNGRER